MHPFEAKILGSLRHHNLWEKWGEHFPKRWFESDEAKDVRDALETLHKTNGDSKVIPNSWIKEMVDGEFKLPGNLPERAADEVLRKLRTNLGVIQVTKSLGRRVKKGEALDSADLADELRILKDLETVGKQQDGQESLVPRPAHTMARSKPWTKRKTIPTFLHGGLDKHLKGGVRRGDLCLLQAPSSHGKTSFLCLVAYRAAKKGLNVVFVTCETYDTEILERLDHVRLAHRAKAIPPKIHLLYKETPTMGDIEQITNNVKKMDMLIVDHADEIRTAIMDWTFSTEEIYRGLRSLGHRRNCVVWTATQEHDPRSDYDIKSQRNRGWGSQEKIFKVDLHIGVLTRPKTNRCIFTLHKRRGHGVRDTDFRSQFNPITMQLKDESGGILEE